MEGKFEVREVLDPTVAALKMREQHVKGCRRDSW